MTLPEASSRAALSRRGILVLALGSGCRKKPPLRIAAASDLVRVLPLILGSMKDDAEPPVVTYGSTGKLATQIEHGAPFDVFLAAHERYLAPLEARGLLRPGTRRPFALGRLSLVAATPCPRDLTLSSLTDKQYARIALANPEHAPYGAAARQALEKAGVLSVVAPRLVFAENVQQALMFVRSGNANAALVARSLVEPGDVCAAAIDPSFHEPIPQAAAVTAVSGDPDRAGAIVSFLTSEAARVLLARGGFALPG